MSIVSTKGSKSTATTPKFTINIGDDQTVEFRPTATFAHIDAAKVMKVIAKAQPDVTAENKQGQVNFKFSIKGKTGVIKNVGFVNYYDNDLDDESEESEVNVVLQELQTTLRKVKIGDISLPLTASQADDMLDNL